MIGPDIGYLQLRHLPQKASRELEVALADLASRVKDGKKLRGLVLDLRGNLGGVLEQAIKVTNDFVESGVIARMTGLKGQYVEEKKATKEGMATNVPLAVLVDERSAAGAEVVAAALKDLGRAIVLGQRTPGEGTVQVLYVYGERDGGPPIALLRWSLRAEPIPAVLGAKPVHFEWREGALVRLG